MVQRPATLNTAASVLNQMVPTQSQSRIKLATVTSQSARKLAVMPKAVLPSSSIQAQIMPAVMQDLEVARGQQTHVHACLPKVTGTTTGQLKARM